MEFLASKQDILFQFRALLFCSSVLAVGRSVSSQAQITVSSFLSPFSKNLDITFDRPTLSAQNASGLQSVGRAILSSPVFKETE